MPGRAGQPGDGLRRSGGEAADQVEGLCQTVASSEAAGRTLMQLMSEMSISKNEGEPTRRYNP